MFLNGICLYKPCELSEIKWKLKLSFINVWQEFQINAPYKYATMEKPFVVN